MLFRSLQLADGGAARAHQFHHRGRHAGFVAPFILRGVTLAGIDSVMCPLAHRLKAWSRLATDLDMGKLDTTISHAGLAEVLDLAPKILKGQVRGRVVVDVRK